MGLLIGAGIVLVCHALSWFIVDHTKTTWSQDRILAFLYSCAIGVLCAVIW